MPEKKELKPHVDEHLKKRSVHPDDLPDSVIAVLNSLSPDELKALERVGAALEEAKVDTPTRVSMVH